MIVRAVSETHVLSVLLEDTMNSFLRSSLVLLQSSESKNVGEKWKLFWLFQDGLQIYCCVRGTLVLFGVVSEQHIDV